MMRLLALVEKHLGNEWVGSVEWLRSLDTNSIDEIERRLIAGDIAGVVKEVESAALRFAAETHSQYVRAAETGSKWLDDQVTDRLIRYDQTNPRAIERARRNQLELVQGMTEDARQTVRSVVVEGSRTGANPREMARDIRQSIGLTPSQEQAVRNYRRALESGDYANATGRALHDGRFKPKPGAELSPEQIDKMTERYRQNYIAYRAETIARTESAKNVHEGLADAYKQAIDRGDITPDQLVKEWIPGPRTQHARPTHHAAELLRQRPKMDEAFDVGGVRMMFPGQGPVDETANCRCTFGTTLKP